MSYSMALFVVSTTLLASCASLLGESFDGYEEAADAGSRVDSSSKRDAGRPATGGSHAQGGSSAGVGGRRANSDAGPSVPNTLDAAAAGSMKAPAPTMNNMVPDAGANETSTDSDAGGVDVSPGGIPPLGTHCDGTPSLEISMHDASELTDWIVTSSETPTPVEHLAFVADDGSPEHGAGLLNPKFTAFNQSVKVGLTKLPARALDCISIRVKVLDSPNNPQLQNEKAGWLLWAVDNSSCYAQAELPSAPYFHFELSKAEQWYELGWQGDKLVGAHECPFNAGQVSQVGVGFVSGSTQPWDAKFLIDTLRLY